MDFNSKLNETLNKERKECFVILGKEVTLYHKDKILTFKNQKYPKVDLWTQEKWDYEEAISFLKKYTDYFECVVYDPMKEELRDDIVTERLKKMYNAGFEITDKIYPEKCKRLMRKK